MGFLYAAMSPRVFVCVFLLNKLPSTRWQDVGQGIPGPAQPPCLSATTLPLSLRPSGSATADGRSPAFLEPRFAEPTERNGGWWGPRWPRALGVAGSSFLHKEPKCPPFSHFLFGAWEGWLVSGQLLFLALGCSV